MSETNWTSIILAAGKGTRMKSPLPKVLHPVAGQPMIQRVIKSCMSAEVKQIRVVVGYGQKLVGEMIKPFGVQTFVQETQQGTADAVKSAKPEDLDGNVIIMNGDHPLVFSEDLKNAIRVFKDEKLDLAVITAVVKNPGTLGRVVRHKNQLVAIVEAKDASADTLKINEINTGIYLAKAEVLQKTLERVRNNNAQNEYYLTDIISIALTQKYKVDAIKLSARVAHGVNTQVELAAATKYCFKRKILNLLENGVVILDPKNTYIEDAVEVGPGSVIYPNVFLKGNTHIGSYSVVESHCFINSSHIGNSVQVKAGSYLEACIVKSKASVGPYARLRPDTVIGEEAHVGNFVEMKKVQFGARSKAGHLTYLGDAEVGEDTNIGCGTITCNYATDHQKYKTKIGKNVFVGSDTQFIAPVTIGDGAVIGSGSTITKDIPPNALGVARAKQVIKENYKVKNKTSTEEE